MSRVVQHQDYYDLSGTNFNFYTEKQIELAAVNNLNTGLMLSNNREYFEKHPFTPFNSQYHPFDAYNDHYLLEIKRTSKDRSLCYKWGYDFDQSKFKRMRDYWWQNSNKQILILVLFGVRTWEDRDEIKNFMNLNCKGVLYPVPIKKNTYLESITRYDVKKIWLSDDICYPIFDYHDATSFPEPVDGWFERHFTGEKATEWLAESFGRALEKEKEDKFNIPTNEEVINSLPEHQKFNLKEEK
jgi:hypothetical protein